MENENTAVPERDDIVLCGTFNYDHEERNKSFLYVGKLDPRRDTGDLRNSKRVFIDCDKSKVILICGKRGSGKSYTMGVFVEELAKLMDYYPNKLSVAILDTMGTFLGLGNPNDDLVEATQNIWELTPNRQDNIRIYVSNPTIEKIREKRRRFKYSHELVQPLYLRPGDLDPEDWLYLSGWDLTQPSGSLLNEAVMDAQEAARDAYDTTENLTINNLITALNLIPSTRYNKNIFRNVNTRLRQFSSWNLFANHGPRIRDFVEPGIISIFDLSLTGFSDKSSLDSLFISLFTRKIFIERMISMKTVREEGKRQTRRSEDIPYVWLVVDEAHKYLGSKSYAKNDLRKWVQQGRSPGLGTIMATQNPGLFPQDITTNTDLIISHKLITKNDVDRIKQMAFRSEVDGRLFEQLPDRKGSAIIIDTESTAEAVMTYIRPRRTLHTGYSESLNE